jgi:GNAT superfamily N-acetyltransferase
MLAAFATDDPDGLPMSARQLQVLFERPNEPAQTWYVCGDRPGSAKAVYHMRLPDRENRNRAILYLDVHPEYRRHGIGSALLRHATRQAALDGRSVLGGEAFIGSAGDAFARRAGATPVTTDARRVLILGKLPEGHVASLRESAVKAAAGYSTVSWTGRAPGQYLPGLAAVWNAMNDGPRGPGREDRIWDAERIRRDAEDPQELAGNRTHSVAALHDATGEVAALTRLSVNPEFPRWGHQMLTAVSRPHRGHRLGLLVKAEMLSRLAEAEPGVERIVTGNDTANRHMIAINEALGYELLDPQVQNYEIQIRG